MLKQVLKTVVSVAATAALLALCSNQPTYAGTPKPATAITSNYGQLIHIIGTDNKVYKYAANQTWTAYTSANLPAGYTLTRIAIPDIMTQINNLVYVLCTKPNNTNRIYSHSATSTTGNWNQVPTLFNGTTVNPLDISCGGDPNLNSPYYQYLWMLGLHYSNNYDCFRNNGTNNTWILAFPGPVPGIDPRNGLPETPVDAKPDNIAVDYLGNVFCHLPVHPGGYPTGPIGHIAWAGGQAGYNSVNNPYNTVNGVGALDWYGVQKDCFSISDVSSNSCISYYRIADGLYYINIIPWNDYIYTSQLTSDFSSGFGVTTSATTYGDPWVIAKQNKYVWKSTYVSGWGGHNPIYNWANP